jgi:outer membrane protein assembly factor BamA
MPLWEGVLVWPVRVISYPLYLVSAGLGETVEFFDEKKVIYRLSQLLGPRQGPFGVLVQARAGGLSGFGGGLAAEHDALLGSGNRFRVSATTTIHGDLRTTLGIRSQASSTGEIDVGTGYRRRRNARYFGLGPQTQEADESFFQQELAWLGASYRQGLGSKVFLKGEVLFSTFGTGSPREEDVPWITEQFAGALPAGYGTHSYGVSLSATLSHETPAETGRPMRGGIRRLRAAYFQGIGNDDAAFWTYRAELQQFVPLWYRYHTLAVRAHMSWIDPLGTDPVPFQRLMTNDDPDLMRGFRDFRWRDRGMMVFSAEYRWPLWAAKLPDRTGLDVYVLTDVGQVFGHIDQVSFDNLTFSYGAGIRFLNVRGFVLRVEFARSNEEVVWRLRGDQIFQFARGGLYYGRDPVPTR